MKKLLLGLALMFVICPAWTMTEVHEVAKSSSAYYQVTVSSFEPTQMDATRPGGRFVIAVQNQDATALLRCMTSSGTLTTTNGWIIPPGYASLTLALDSHGDGYERMKVWCINNSGTGTTQAGTWQLK